MSSYAVHIQLNDLSQRRIQYRTRWIVHATIWHLCLSVFSDSTDVDITVRAFTLKKNSLSLPRAHRLYDRSEITLSIWINHCPFFFFHVSF